MLLRLATRKSPLALWQAEHAASLLCALATDVEVELLPMSTSGDKMLFGALATVGGKGLFVKELEQSLLDEVAHVAVHSMKDVPVELPQGLHIGALLARGDPRDAFVCKAYKSFMELPVGARVGTSSLRRQCQLRALRPDLRLVILRGNVNSRVDKLGRGELDAVVLAAAGLKRLGLEAHITEYLAPEVCLPAIAQGTIGIECRTHDPVVGALLERLDHADTRVRVRAERAVNARLGGSCQVPVAAYAELQEGRLLLRALVGSPDGQRILRVEGQGQPADAEALGTALAEELLSRGAGAILAAL